MFLYQYVLLEYQGIHVVRFDGKCLLALLLRLFHIAGDHLDPGQDDPGGYAALALLYRSHGGDPGAAYVTGPDQISCVAYQIRRVLLVGSGHEVQKTFGIVQLIGFHQCVYAFAVFLRADVFVVEIIVYGVPDILVRAYHLVCGLSSFEASQRGLVQPVVQLQSIDWVMSHCIGFGSLVYHERRRGVHDPLVHHLRGAPVLLIRGYPGRCQEEIRVAIGVIIGAYQLVCGRILVTGEPIAVDLIQLPELGRAGGSLIPSLVGGLDQCSVPPSAVRVLPVQDLIRFGAAGVVLISFFSGFDRHLAVSHALIELGFRQRSVEDVLGFAVGQDL